MNYLGDIAAGQILDTKFTLVALPTGSVPAPLAGSPIVSVYKSNSAAQSISGVTLTVNFDSITGMNHLRIDTSADGTFYAQGDFQVVITQGTVGGNTVAGFVVAEFSISNRTSSAAQDANANADALLDRANGIETGWTLRQALRIVLAALGGKLSGAATNTALIRDVTDAKTRITATVDADGNRSAVSYDKT
jgi:hypothetical protein